RLSEPLDAIPTPERRADPRQVVAWAGVEPLPLQFVRFEHVRQPCRALHAVLVEDARAAVAAVERRTVERRPRLIVGDHASAGGCAWSCAGVTSSASASRRTV